MQIPQKIVTKIWRTGYTEPPYCSLPLDYIQNRDGHMTISLPQFLSSAIQSWKGISTKQQSGEHILWWLHVQGLAQKFSDYQYKNFILQISES